MSFKELIVKPSGDLSYSIAGEAVELAEDGVAINGGKHFVLLEGDFTSRRQITVKSRPATLDARTGVYGKDKKSVSIAHPQTLSDGRVVFNTIRIEREVHPLFENASAVALNKLAVEVLFHEDTEDFWLYGVIA